MITIYLTDPCITAEDIILCKNLIPSQKSAYIKSLTNFNEPMILLVCDEEDQTVIGIDRKGFVCLCCKYGRHSCRHIKEVKSMVEQSPIPDSLIDIVGRSEVLQTKHHNAYVKRPLSTGRIAMDSQPPQMSVYEGTYCDVLMNIADGTIALIPDFDGEECDVCCSSFEDECTWQLGVKLVSRSFIRSVSGM